MATSPDEAVARARDGESPEHQASAPQEVRPTRDRNARRRQRLGGDETELNLTKRLTRFCKHSHIPQWLLERENVEYLFLTNNHLRDLPEEIHHWRRLKFLELSQNPFTEFPAALLQLEWLKSLTIDGARISTLPQKLCCLRSLEELALDQNLLTSLPDSIGDLQYLRKLRLRWNRLEGLPDSFSKLQQMEDLDLQNNSFKQLPLCVCKLRRLTTLSLANVDDSEFRRPSAKNNLETLPEEIGMCTSLQTLRLDGNKQFAYFPRGFLVLLQPLYGKMKEISLKQVNRVDLQGASSSQIFFDLSGKPYMRKAIKNVIVGSCSELCHHICTALQHQKSSDCNSEDGAATAECCKEYLTHVQSAISPSGRPETPTEREIRVMDKTYVTSVCIGNALLQVVSKFVITPGSMCTIVVDLSFFTKQKIKVEREGPKADLVEFNSHVGQYMDVQKASQAGTWRPGHETSQAVRTAFQVVCVAPSDMAADDAKQAQEAILKQIHEKLHGWRNQLELRLQYAKQSESQQCTKKVEQEIQCLPALLNSGILLTRKATAPDELEGLESYQDSFHQLTNPTSEDALHHYYNKYVAEEVEGQNRWPIVHQVVPAVYVQLGEKLQQLDRIVFGTAEQIIEQLESLESFQSELIFGLREKKGDRFLPYVLNCLRHFSQKSKVVCIQLPRMDTATSSSTSSTPQASPPSHSESKPRMDTATSSSTSSTPQASPPSHSESKPRMDTATSSSTSSTPQAPPPSHPESEPVYLLCTVSIFSTLMKTICVKEEVEKRITERGVSSPPEAIQIVTNLRDKGILPQHVVEKLLRQCGLDIPAVHSFLDLLASNSIAFPLCSRAEALAAVGSSVAHTLFPSLLSLAVSLPVCCPLDLDTRPQRRHNDVLICIEFDNQYMPPLLVCQLAVKCYQCEELTISQQYSSGFWGSLKFPESSCNSSVYFHIYTSAKPTSVRLVLQASTECLLYRAVWAPIELIYPLLTEVLSHHHDINYKEYSLCVTCLSQGHDNSIASEEPEYRSYFDVNSRGAIDPQPPRKFRNEIFCKKAHKFDPLLVFPPEAGHPQRPPLPSRRRPPRLQEQCDYTTVKLYIDKSPCPFEQELKNTQIEAAIIALQYQLQTKGFKTETSDLESEGGNLFLRQIEEKTNAKSIEIIVITPGMKQAFDDLCIQESRPDAELSGSIKNSLMGYKVLKSNYNYIPLFFKEQEERERGVNLEWLPTIMSAMQHYVVHIERLPSDSPSDIVLAKEDVEALEAAIKFACSPPVGQPVEEEFHGCNCMA